MTGRSSLLAAGPQQQQHGRASDPLVHSMHPLGRAAVRSFSFVNYTYWSCNTPCPLQASTNAAPGGTWRRAAHIKPGSQDAELRMPEQHTGACRSKVTTTACQQGTATHNTQSIGMTHACQQATMYFALCRSPRAQHRLQVNNCSEQEEPSQQLSNSTPTQWKVGTDHNTLTTVRPVAATTAGQGQPETDRAAIGS